MSEATEPAVMIAVLDAWFDRVAGAVHAFGGEVLKFIGDGMLAIFPVTGTPAEACEAALRALVAARAGMAHLNAGRHQQGLPTLSFGAALHLGEILWGNIGSSDRLDFTAIGPAVNLVSRLEGLCKPLGWPVLISGAVAAETTTALVPLGEHTLRGIGRPVRCSRCRMRDKSPPASSAAGTHVRPWGVEQDTQHCTERADHDKPSDCGQADQRGASGQAEVRGGLTPYLMVGRGHHGRRVRRARVRR